MKNRFIETLESPLLQNVSTKIKVWRRYCCVVVALLLQNKPTVSNGWRIAVVDVSFSVALLFRSPPAMVGFNDIKKHKSIIFNCVVVAFPARYGGIC